MASLNTRSTSFVVRIWWEESGSGSGVQRFWRGWVQHVRSGEAIYFQEVEALLAFVERFAGNLHNRVHSSPDVEDRAPVFPVQSR